jgi:hypothetical protein
LHLAIDGQYRALAGLELVTAENAVSTTLQLTKKNKRP